MLDALGNIDFVLRLIIMAICGIAWGVAGFPHLAEVVPSGLCILGVGAFALMTWKKEQRRLSRYWPISDLSGPI